MKRFVLYSLFWSMGISCLAAQSKDSCACCDTAYRQFDFWVGDWQAKANQTVVGYNKIVLLQDSCILQENWRSIKGDYTGTSYNYYDASTKKWWQLWIDNQGQNLRLSGGLEGNKMVLASDRRASSLTDSLLHRITWTPIGLHRVRQHWQSRHIDSTKWETLFDAEYEPLN